MLTHTITDHLAILGRETYRIQVVPGYLYTYHATVGVCGVGITLVALLRYHYSDRSVP